MAGRRGRKAEWYRAQGEPTNVRVALERRWWDRLDFQPQLASVVTARHAADEPFHRWTHFKQGFSPVLVREFVKNTSPTRASRRHGPILDPFSGSGTTLIECARLSVGAVGVEAVRSLTFLTEARMARSFPPLPQLPSTDEWPEIADRLDDPVHRAALILAVARRHTSDGRLRGDAKPLSHSLAEVLHEMEVDLRTPVPMVGRIHHGDARRLEMIEDQSVSGILTSPPYLSRHDYSRITAPHELVYRHWYGRTSDEARSDSAHIVGNTPDPTESTAAPKPAQDNASQMRAHTVLRKRGKSPNVKDEPQAPDESGFHSARAAFPHAPHDEHERSARAIHPAVTEVKFALKAIGQRRLAETAGNYFVDLRQAVSQWSRVIQPGGVCWIVMGGARLKGVYVPSDLILAELAQDAGFEVVEVLVARQVIDAGRKLGRLTGIAPRESILSLQLQ